MAFCVQCGKEGQGEDEFCNRCGTKLRNSGPTQTNNTIPSLDVVPAAPDVIRPVDKSNFGIGLHVEPITPELRSRYNITAESGVAIVGVFAGAIAMRAGAQVGDVLFAFNSFEIRSPDNYEEAMLWYFRSGQPLNLSIVRGNAILQLDSSSAHTTSAIRRGPIDTSPSPVSVGNIGGHRRFRPLVVILIGLVIIAVVFGAIHLTGVGSGGSLARTGSPSNHQKPKPLPPIVATSAVPLTSTFISLVKHSEDEAQLGPYPIDTCKGSIMIDDSGVNSAWGIYSLKPSCGTTGDEFYTHEIRGSWIDDNKANGVGKTGTPVPPEVVNGGWDSVTVQFNNRIFAALSDYRSDLVLFNVSGTFEFCPNGSGVNDAGTCSEYLDATACDQVIGTYISNEVTGYSEAVAPGISAIQSANYVMQAGNKFNGQWKYPDPSNVAVAFNDVANDFGNAISEGVTDFSGTAASASAIANHDCAEYVNPAGIPNSALNDFNGFP